jgi:hypothetical protein
VSFLSETSPKSSIGIRIPSNLVTSLTFPSFLPLFFSKCASCDTVSAQCLRRRESLTSRRGLRERILCSQLGLLCQASLSLTLSLSDILWSKDIKKLYLQLVKKLLSIITTPPHHTQLWTQLLGKYHAEDISLILRQHREAEDHSHTLALSSNTTPLLSESLNRNESRARFGGAKDERFGLGGKLDFLVDHFIGM